jgi:hypothetical protein
LILQKKTDTETDKVSKCEKIYYAEMYQTWDFTKCIAVTKCVVIKKKIYGEHLSFMFVKMDNV